MLLQNIFLFQGAVPTLLSLPESQICSSTPALVFVEYFYTSLTMFVKVVSLQFFMPGKFVGGAGLDSEELCFQENLICIRVHS
jgi:hypothetical protein